MSAPARLQTGMTALHWAAAFARVPVVEKLLLEGADVFAEDAVCAPCACRFVRSRGVTIRTQQEPKNKYVGKGRNLAVLEEQPAAITDSG